MLANGTGTTATQNGAKNWYIVYPDYAFGQDMKKNFTEAAIARPAARWWPADRDAVPERPTSPPSCSRRRR